MEYSKKDLQGGILSPHGRSAVLIAFVHFPEYADQSIRKMIKVFPATSAAEQKYQAREYKKKGGDDSSVFRSICLSESCYRKLGLSRNMTPRDIAFRRGARMSSVAYIKERGASVWEPAFKKGYDLLILVGTNSVEILEDQKDKLKSFIASVPSVVIHFEMGNKLCNQDNQPIEHFGFRDGISNPSFFDPNKKHQETNSSVYNPLQIVLARDPHGTYGSYLVYRKLIQDVERFNQQVQMLSELLGKDLEEVMALTIGRYKDGTPLCPHNSINDFDYQDDPDGLVSPLHSHMRKANSRKAEDLPHRLILRRGIPFYDKKTREVGLHFMCFQQDIFRQFEFIQRSWFNDQLQKNGSGADPISNTLARQIKAQKWPNSNGGFTRYSFQQVVKVLGSGYYFVPSISGLEKLAQ